MSDILNFDYINSLPQPLLARFYGGDIWPVYDIEVQCAYVRIDVCGKLQNKKFADVSHIIDGYGETYSSDTFYID